MNVSFKQVQPLPALSPAMLVGEHAPHPIRATCTTRPTQVRPETRAATPPASARQLPRPQADQCTGEQALFAILALSAIGCVGQVIATVIHWAPSSPGFTAWVAQMLA